MFSPSHTSLEVSLFFCHQKTLDRRGTTLSGGQRARWACWLRGGVVTSKTTAAPRFWHCFFLNLEDWLGTAAATIEARHACYRLPINRVLFRSLILPAVWSDPYFPSIAVIRLGLAQVLYRHLAMEKGCQRLL